MCRESLKTKPQESVKQKIKKLKQKNENLYRKIEVANAVIILCYLFSLFFLSFLLGGSDTIYGCTVYSWW